MSDIFRIIDRLCLTGIGTVYVLKLDFHSNLRLDDILFDLRGNRFQVRGIEMGHKLFSGDDMENMTRGVRLELLDGVEAEGNLLAKKPMDISFLFCNHILYPTRVDEDYEDEYRAAGLEHKCALFSYEDMEKGMLSLYGEEISGLAIYRGWMMKPEMYETFYRKLEEKNIILINSPEEYAGYHLLPGWYEAFQENTAWSVWETKGTLESAMQLTKGLEGSYIVKDYVKSRKHEWFDACFIKDIADEKAAGKVIDNFISRQGSELVGGVVLRKFEKLKGIGYHEKSGMPLSEEYRVFILAGKILVMDDYWRENENIKLPADEILWIERLAAEVKSNFVTMDLARREDGRLLVMEMGDGQVSGLQQIEADRFYKAFQMN